IRSLMARPAASSFALLMRNPEDRRCKARDSSLPLRTRFLCAFSDETFVLIDRAMSVQSFGLAPALQRARRNRGGFRSMGLTAAPSRSGGGHEAQDVRTGRGTHLPPGNVMPVTGRRPWVDAGRL